MIVEFGNKFSEFSKQPFVTDVSLVANVRAILQWRKQHASELLVSIDDEADDSSFHRKESLAPTDAYNCLSLMKGLMSYSMPVSMMLRTLLFMCGMMKFDEFENWMRIFESAHDHTLPLDTYPHVIPSLQEEVAGTMDDLMS